MLIAIAAMTSDRLIGNNNTIPRHLPDDQKLFKDLTFGHTVVMGRKTYDSLPLAVRPLPWRHNIVISSQKNYQLSTDKKNTSVEVVHTIEDVINKNHEKENIFIIWWSQIYKLFLPHCDKLYISEVKWSYEGDTYFPDFKDQFTEISREVHINYDFVVYGRIIN